MTNASPTIIRLSITDEVRRALVIAKERYPALSDPEILKLGLSKIVTEDTCVLEKERFNIRAGAAKSVGDDYLNDPGEDIYGANMGRRVNFL